MREQVSKMMTDAQRRAAEITDTAKAKAQEITDEAEVHRTKTISQVNAEVEQIRADISAQQEEATKKVNELLTDLNERREAANKQMLEHAAEAGRIFEVQTCIDEWATMLRTKKTTVQIMRKLKAAGYRLYYLTNIPTDIMDDLRQREWFSLFDGGIASCDVHLCKPEPEIFTTLMQTCRLAYDESIFVDDNKANAQAAYNLGITGILYKNPKSFTRALGACGIEIE